MSGAPDLVVEAPTPARTRVVLDAAPLRDGRATAGIGRYVSSLAAALAGVESVDLHVSIPHGTARSERYPLRYLHGQPRLAAMAFRCHADVVHATANEPAVAWPPSRQVVTVHDILPWHPTESRGDRFASAYWAVQARRLRRCAAVVVPAIAVAVDVAALLGVEPERVTVVPEGVDPVFQPDPSLQDVDRRARLGIAGGPYAMWTGSMRANDPRKALDLLISAVADARRTHEDAHLVLVGHGGQEAFRLRAVADRQGVPVTFPGFVGDDDLAALLRGAAAAVVPSLAEGFGLPALEALASGTVLVAARVGAIPDLCGDAALLVRPGDRRDLAAALDRAFRDGPEARRLRRHGPGQAAPYTWDRAARETAAVYARVAGARGPRRGSAPTPA